MTNKLHHSGSFPICYTLKQIRFWSIIKLLPTDILNIYNKTECPFGIFCPCVYSKLHQDGKDLLAMGASPSEFQM